MEGNKPVLKDDAAAPANDAVQQPVALTVIASETTAPTAPAPEKRRALREDFRAITDVVKQDKGVQVGAIVTGILLGTTALVTPLLTGMIGTGIAVAAGAYALRKAWQTPHATKADKLRKAGLGLAGLAGLAAPVLGPLVGAAAALGGGFYLLTKTSDTTVNNSSALGTKAGINQMALGVGLGVLTSMPELFVSAGAMIAGAPALGIGNIVGSNIANILLILGGTALIKNIDVKKASWKFNMAAMAGATALFGVQMVAGVMNPVVGGLLLAGFGAYMWKSFRDAKKESAAAPAPANDAQAEAAKKMPEYKLPKWGNIAMGLAGVAGLVGAAYFSVAAATAVGVAAGISPAVIGLLAVAVGTSLPELMVNFKAARAGNTDIAIGNILGSNVFNLVLIGGLLSVAGGMGSLAGNPMPADFNARAGIAGFVNTLAFGASALLTGLALKFNKESIGKKQGIISLGLYAAYTAATFLLGQSSTPAATPDAAATVPAVTPVVPAPPPPAMR